MSKYEKAQELKNEFIARRDEIETKYVKEDTFVSRGLSKKELANIRYEHTILTKAIAILNKLPSD